MSYQHFASEPANDLTFTVGDDPFVFQALPIPPAEAQLAMAQAGADVALIGPVAMCRASVAFLEAVLAPASFERLSERLRSQHDPISIQHLESIVVWLLGEYAAADTSARH